MKTKINKILGIVLTASVLASLVVGLAASPAAAGANKWSKFTTPSVGADGEWFMDPDITRGPGPWARAIDGTFYAYAQLDGDDYMFKSSDARAWDRLDRYFSAEAGPALDIAVSPKSAGTLWVLDTNGSVWKTSNSGSRWSEVRALTGEGTITSIAVGYVGDEARVFLGTMGTGAANPGSVFMLDEDEEAGWVDLNVAGSTKHRDINGVLVTWTDCQILDIALSPKYSSDRFIVAVALVDDLAAAGFDNTYATTRYGTEEWAATIYDAAFDPTGETDNNVQDALSASIWIPDDFDSDEESGKMQYFVGIRATDTDDGDVYRITTKTASDRNVKGFPPSAESIFRIDGVGNVGSANILAGTSGGRVYYSTNNGTSFTRDRKRPTGLFVYPIVADDFSTSKEAWVAVDGFVTADDDAYEGAVSRSKDGGDLWNQISLIDTDMDTIIAIAPSPNYNSDKTVFAITGPEVEGNGEEVYSAWKYNGDDWERIESAGLGKPPPTTITQQTVESNYISFNSLMLTRTFGTDNTVFLLDSANADPLLPGPIALRSTDGGGRFLGDATTPFSYFSADVGNFAAWAVIDKDTRLVGGDNGTIYRTINNGDTWTKAEEVDGVISSFALDPNNKDNALAANEDQVVYLSTNGGRTWRQRPTGADVPDVGADRTFLAFDPKYASNNIIYAADEDGGVYRAAIGTDDEWVEISGGAEFFTWPEEILGDAFESVAPSSQLNMAVSPGGTLYTIDDDGEPVARCINPTAPDDPERDAPYFETIGDGWDNSPGGAYSLKMTVGAAATMLWTIATGDTPDEIWVYNDEIIAPVLSSPADGSTSGRTSEVTVAWKAVPNADEYNVWWDIDPGFPNVSEDRYNATVTSTSARITGLEPGRTYYWKVVVSPQEPAVSPFSARWSFTTGLAAAEWNPFVGGVPEAPSNGATNVPIKPSFAWNSADWATGYEFVLATAPTYASPVVSKTGANALAGTTYLAEQNLQYNTTYYWRVRAISRTSQSAWAEGVFTTQAPPPTPPAPPPPPAPTPPPKTPAYIWVIIGIGAALVIAVIILIVRTRRVA